MRATARFTHERVPFDMSKEGHLVISLTGEKTGEATQRPLLGIIPVIDRTGSMASDNKLATAVSALDHLVGYLEDSDALGLIAFDDRVDEVVEAGTGNRAQYRSALQELYPRGMTNLGAGLIRGVGAVTALAKRFSEETSWFEVRIVLISDGLANVGIRNPEQLAAITSDLPYGVRVTTIGVGRDCDHDLLRKIAASGGGGYGFAENADAIPGLLGAEFGGLLSMDAANIEVVVEARDSIKLGAPIGVTHTQTSDNICVVQIPTLLQGEERHIVFPTTTVAPGRKHARRISAAEITIEYQKGEERLTEELLPKLFFDGTTVSTVSPTMQEIVETALAGAALREAEKLASQGSWRQAQTVLTRAASSFSTQGVANSIDTASVYYSSAEGHSSSAVERSSMSSALNADARLLGSSEAFDAQWARNMGGSYTTDAMRQSAAETTRAVRGQNAPLHNNGAEPDAGRAEGMYDGGPYAAGTSDTVNIVDGILLNGGTGCTNNVDSTDSSTGIEPGAADATVPEDAATTEPGSGNSDGGGDA